MFSYPDFLHCPPIRETPEAKTLLPSPFTGVRLAGLQHPRLRDYGILVRDEGFCLLCSSQKLIDFLFEAEFPLLLRHDFYHLRYSIVETRKRAQCNRGAFGKV